MRAPGSLRIVRIGELARATGVTTRALRFYEERGLLTATRAPNGYREYAGEAVTRVANIRFLLDSGLTLDDVAHFRYCLDGDLPNTRAAAPQVAVARRRLAVLDDRIAALVRVRDQLAARLDRAARPAPTAPCDPPARPRPSHPDGTRPSAHPATPEPPARPAMRDRPDRVAAPARNGRAPARGGAGPDGRTVGA